MAVVTAMTAQAVYMEVHRVSDREDLADIHERYWFVVTADVDMGGRTVEIPEGSVLEFCGGSLRGGRLRLDNVEVRAAAYPVFAGCQVEGTIANHDIDAAWFGEVYGDDCSEAVNRALAFAGARNRVVLGAGNVNVRKPLELSKDGQKLHCAGTLRVHGDIAAVRLTAANPDVDIHCIEGAVADTRRVRDFNGTGILFAGNVRGGNVRVGHINCVETSIDLAPMQAVKGKAGVEGNSVYFQYIRSVNGIRFDVTPGNVANQRTTTWINNNYFNGGRLQCRKGIVVVPPKGNDTKRHKRLDGNFFDCIGFEGYYTADGIFSLANDTEADCADTRLLDLRYMSNTTMRDMRMSENLPGLNPGNQKGYPWMQFADCRDVTIDTKSGIYRAHVDVAHSTHCHNVRIGHCFTDKQGYLFNDMEWMTVFTPDNQASGRCQAVVTQADAAVDSVNIIDASALPDSVGWTEIFSDVPGADDVKVPVRKCVVSVPPGRKLLVDFGRQYQSVNTPVQLTVNLGAGAVLSVKSAKTTAPWQIKTSGCYLITWDIDCNLKLLNLTKSTHP